MAFDTSDPKVQKALLVVLLLAGTCYGYWAYIMAPKQEEVAKAEQELALITTRVEQARQVVAQGDTLQLRIQLEKREEELKLAQQLLPVSENLPMLLRAVTRTGEMNNLDFALFEPQTPIQYQLYQERPYKLKIRGGYHETARFLSEVAGMDVIVKPTSLSMVRDTRVDNQGDETLTADVVLTTYLLIAGTPDSLQNQQKGNK